MEKITMGQPYSTTFDELLGQGHAIDAVCRVVAARLLSMQRNIWPDDEK